MDKIKKGDIVGRKSYGKDIIFVVKNIITTSKGKIAILRGLVERVEADCKIEDLEKIEKERVRDCVEILNTKLEKRIMNSQRDVSNEQYRIGILNLNKRNRELSNNITKNKTEESYE